MFCPHCGAAHDASAQHCPACGRSLTDVSLPVSAPSPLPVPRRPVSPWIKRIGLAVLGLAVLLGAGRAAWAITQTPQRAAAAYLAAVQAHDEAAVLNMVVWSGAVSSPYLHGAFLTRALRTDAATLPRHPTWRVSASGPSAAVVTATGTHHSVRVTVRSTPGVLGLPVWHVRLTPAVVSATVYGAHSGNAEVPGLAVKLDGLPVSGTLDSAGAFVVLGVFPGPHTLQFSGPAITPSTVDVGAFQSRTVTVHVAPAAKKAITAVFAQFLTAYAQDIHSGQYTTPASALAGQGVDTFLSQDAAPAYGTPSGNSYTTTLKSTGDTLSSWTPAGARTVTFTSQHSWAISYAALPACAQQLFCYAPSNTTGSTTWAVTVRDVKGHWYVVDVLLDF